MKPLNFLTLVFISCLLFALPMIGTAEEAVKDFGVAEVFKLLPSFLALGTPGLIVFGVIVVAFTILGILAGINKYKKQVHQAEVDTAQGAAEANVAMDDTDSMGDSFLNDN